MMVTMMLVLLSLLLTATAAYGLNIHNATNIFLQRSLGADAEDKTVRRAPPVSNRLFNGPRFREGEIVVHGSPLDLPPGIKVRKYLKKADVTVVKVTPGNEKALIKRLRDKGKMAEENFYMYASMTPNDTYFSPYQWHMTTVQAQRAWDTTTGQGVIVAVLDTGLMYDKNIPANKMTQTYDGIGCVVSPYNTINDSRNVADGDGHGTHV